MNAEELARQAVTAAQQGNPKQAKEALQAAIAASPERLDLRHALTVTTLQLGDPLEALAMNQDLYDMAMEVADEAAMALMAQIVLTRAAIFEDLAQPGEAEAAYREVLGNEEGHPSAQQGLGYLLLAWGRAADGLTLLQALADNEGEDPDVREVAPVLGTTMQGSHDESSASLVTYGITPTSQGIYALESGEDLGVDDSLGILLGAPDRKSVV